MRNGWESWGVNSQYHSMPDWSQDWEFSYVVFCFQGWEQSPRVIGECQRSNLCLAGAKGVLHAKCVLGPCASPLPLHLLEKQEADTAAPGAPGCPTWVMQDDSSNASGVWLQLLCSCVEEAKNCCQARYLVQKCKLCRRPLTLNFSSDRIHGSASHCSIC